MAEVYLCDDNELDRRRLATLLSGLAKQYFLDLDIREFADGDAFLRAWVAAKTKPAIVFLDIYMDGVDGIQLARTLRQTDTLLPLIFTTSSEKHGIEAFSVFAGGYLCKPFTRRQLYETVKPYFERLTGEMRSLRVTVNRTERDVLLRDIFYFESAGHSTYMYTRLDTFKCSRDIGRFRESLAGEGAFMPCGKSYIVNLYHVARCDGNTLIMQNGGEVYMPQRLAAELKKYMGGYYYGDDASL